MSLQNSANNSSCGSIEYLGNNGYSQSDVLASQSNNAQDPNPIASNHSIGNDSNFPDTETELDMQMQSQTADRA